MKNSLHLLRQKKGGFALLAVLLILSLLTILVISAEVVACIEQQASYNVSEVDVARQNALFGLNQALNQLQMAAGPDQRITARADILNPNGALRPSSCGYKNDSPAVDSGQTFWTGVWRNTLNDYSGPYQAPFLYYDTLPNGTANTNTSGSTPCRSALLSSKNVSWLVSWPFTTPPDPTQSLASQSITETVEIASGLNINSTANSSLTSGSSSQIDVPVVPILANSPLTNTPSRKGGFAYWVADEGIKAKANVHDPYLGNDPSSTLGYLGSMQHFIMAQSPAVNQALTQNTTAFNCPNAIDIRGLQVLAPTLKSMEYADTTSPTSTWLDFGANNSTYLSDFTVDSYGVIADNFNGGLRKDLTAAFENPIIYQNQFSDIYNGTSNPKLAEPQRKLFSMNALNPTTPLMVTSIDPSNQIFLDGMRWDSLFFYYNIYKNVMPPPSASDPTPSPPGLGAQYSPLNATLPTIIARAYKEKIVTGTSSTGTLMLDPIMPTLAALSLNISLQLHKIKAPTASAPGQYDLLLGSSPLVVLYNPYNVQLTLPSSGNYATQLEVQSDFNSSDGPNHTASPIPPVSWNAFEVVGTGTDPVPSAPISPQSVTSPPTTSSNYLTCAGALGGELFDLSNDDNNPLLPGEMRGYSMPYTTLDASNVGAYTEPFGLAYSNIYSYPSFLVNGGHYSSGYPDLVSSANPGFLEQEEHTLSTNLQAYPDDSIYMVGTSALLSQNTAYIAQNFPCWPLRPYLLFPWSALTSFTLDGANFPPIGNTTPGDPVLVGTVSNLVSGPPVLISSFQDRLPGINGTISTVSVNSTTNTGTVNEPQPIAVPCFGSGAASMNILNTEINGFYRDFGNTVKQNGLPSSLNDISDANMPGKTFDTFWQSGSGTSGSVGTSGGGVRPGGEGNLQVVTKEIPRGPLISLGQFKNMNCGYLAVGAETTFVKLYFPYCPLGGSYPAEIPLNVAYASPPGKTLAGLHALIDSNFLANEALFDSYFLSTVPPSQFATAADANNWPIPASTFTSAVNAQNYINSGQALPNARLTYYCRSNNPNSPSGSIHPNILDLQCPNVATANLRKPAANLLLNGAFNINSTSVAAWQALLSSTSATSPNKQGVANTFGSNAQSQQIINWGSTDNPFLNFASPLVTDIGTFSGNSPWTGVLKLSNPNVLALAQNIVKQIQLRGPFLSLGDFLNRRLDASGSGLGNSGAIQAAIDNLDGNATTSINASVYASANATAVTGLSGCTTTFTPITGVPSYTAFPSGFTQTAVPPTPVNSGSGIPGTLSQPDVVQAIAPAIADRSDTFTIRAYGESVRPGSTTADATAWCEAVVQRVPEYLYAQENNVAANGNFSYDDPTPTVTNADGQHGLSTANYTFGRRFKIISFRWLNKNEL